MAYTYDQVLTSLDSTFTGVKQGSAGSGDAAEKVYRFLSEKNGGSPVVDKGLLMMIGELYRAARDLE